MGHSAGGHSLTKSIHEFPDKIQVAIFIAAAMLHNGFLTPQDLKDVSSLSSRTIGLRT